MAWEAVSKSLVAELSGVAYSEINDDWYDLAVALIERWAGIYNIGNPTSVTEYLDGNGTERLKVKKPPIQSITSVYVDDILIDSSYIEHDDTYVVLVDGTIIHPYLNLRSFPIGDRNVKITYVSGGTDKSVSITIAFIIKELSNIKTGEGAEARLQFFTPNRSEATEKPLMEWGVHGKIRGIIKAFLGTRFRAS